MDAVAGHLGYAALFIGTLLEGETVLFLAGLAAQHGYLWFPAVVAVALIGGFLGDQTLFFVGRRYGLRVLNRFPAAAARAPRIQAMVKRWDVLAIVSVRFLYGLRMAAPVVIGSCGIPVWRLVVFDFIGALLWSLVVGGAGYFAGQAIQQWIGRLDRFAILVLLAALLAAGTAWNVWRARSRSLPAAPGSRAPLP
jgi:membrane protein DedA with SNARE-associated domain